jgi:hypothetical protein
MMSKIKRHVIQVPIYLYVDLTDEELSHVDVDFIIEKKVIDTHKTFGGELHLSTDLLMFDDWDIYETEYEVES